MELREFAERVLFAGSLEEKLRCPEEIRDEQPGPALGAPEAPGRPAELQFKPTGSGQSDFPGLHRLEQERERGRLLHFFANHELLATELMALVLLRFPEAPAAFRRGVFQTLKDEQIHTRLYLERMKQCGVQFGDLPVSGHFWRCVSKMETPLDYVAGLSLTFEQANLDFCRHFARGFQTVGDAETAALLERIYRDEIGHVAYGLKWFRRWKNPGESDWEAFCRQLRFPLSPQRAKGIAFNIEGRRAAGLEAAFVAELDVYSQSKGRTPSVFVFNPLAEGSIAQGTAFTPVKYQAQLAEDLANLPQFLCRQDDLVLVSRRPSVEFLSGLKRAGFALPEFVELKDGAIDPSSSLCCRKTGRLRPWAWGPDSVELLAPLFPNLTGEARTPAGSFNDQVAQLYSKSWSAGLLGKLLKRCPAETWLCSAAEVGVSVDTLPAALDAVTAIRSRGHHKVVVKEAIGLAGHNSIRLWEPAVLEKQRRWMASALERGTHLVVEPWLERELDFSVQLEMSPGGLKACGYTGLVNDLKGQFMANWAAPNYARRIPALVASLLGEPGDSSGRLRRLYEEAFRLLERELRSAGYGGPVGIDSFVYRAAGGGLRLKPIVEINPRYTMGRVLVELMQRVDQGRCGLLGLVSRKAARERGFEYFAAYGAELARRYPLSLGAEPAGRIREGSLCLNEAARAQACLAVFQVGRSLAALPDVAGLGLALPKTDSMPD